MKTPSKIGSCTQQDVELHIEEIWIVSQSANQLPLQIEDASRPVKGDEEVKWSKYCNLNIF